MAAQLATLAQYVADLANLGGVPAVVETGAYRTTSYSYAEVVGRAFAFRDELWRNFIGAGERLLLWGEPGAAWVSAFYGCVLAGVVVVPLDAAFSPEYVARIQVQTAARLLCCSRERRGAVPGVAIYPLEDVLQLPVLGGSQTVMAAGPEALLEIVYTSGATADPKGVMITHGNLLANLRPIAREVERYRGWARPFLPLRFVHLIPLSHLFGQTLGVFIPPLLDGAVVYPAAQTPTFLATTIRRRRASVLVCVPRQLQLLREWALAELRLTRDQVVAQSAGFGLARRWWRWRRLHRRLGWKMWAFVVGAAALPPEEEEFWSALGYAVIQGYGLTETAPAVAITHPFKMRRGAVGRKLAGMEIRIAADGEILVRGPNVSPGYFGAPGDDPSSDPSAFADGWLHTGDLGRLDEHGDLFFLGRKKEVIVTAEGLNVFPSDVERPLDAQPEIAESAVVAARREGQESVFAVLVPTAGVANLESAVARANLQLEPHQRVRGFAAWPEPRLPRTTSTQKLQRVAIAAWVNGHAVTRTASNQGETDWKRFVAGKRGWPVERLRPEMRLADDLALSSLDRVELLTWIETNAGVPVDEAEFNQLTTVAELDTWLQASQAAPAPGPRSAREAPQAEAVLQAAVTWPHCAALRRLRTWVLHLATLPVLRLFVRLSVSGRENLSGLDRPVLFVANHQSILDVPVVLRALPRRFRPWLAPAMGAGHFAALLRPTASPAARRKAWRQLFEARAFFGAYLLSEETGVQNALRYTGRLADLGYCPLIFPEGERSRDGRLLPFRPGIGVFVRQLGLPVVPIVLADVYKLLPTGAERIRRGTAGVRIGRPMQFSGRTAEDITRELETWFKSEVR